MKKSRRDLPDQGRPFFPPISEPSHFPVVWRTHYDGSATRGPSFFALARIRLRNLLRLPFTLDGHGPIFPRSVDFDSIDRSTTNQICRKRQRQSDDGFIKRLVRHGPSILLAASCWPPADKKSSLPKNSLWPRFLFRLFCLIESW